MSRRKHNDILFLEKRLDHLLEVEDYEKAAIVSRWINELHELFDKQENSKKNSNNIFGNNR
jgi:protein-arginine kinase activator protein McsA